MVSKLPHWMSLQRSHLFRQFLFFQIHGVVMPASLQIPTKFKVFLNIDQIFTSLDLRVKILHTSDIVLVFANFQLVESQKVVDVNQKYANIWF